MADDAGAAAWLPGVRALFQQRVSGDDALLRLAGRRFREAGMPAELYAENPDQLEHLLAFVPEHSTLPTVHLSRSANLLQQSGRELVEGFTDRFAGRVAGLVVHDKAGMAERLAELVAAMRALGAPTSARAGRPMVYLEYATGLPIEAFVSVAEQLADVELASMCIDIGHVGIQHARGRPLGLQLGSRLVESVVGRPPAAGGRRSGPGGDPISGAGGPRADRPHRCDRQTGALPPA